MFWNKIFTRLSENCKQSVKIKSGSLAHCNNTYSPRSYASQSLIYAERQNSNGFPKPFATIRSNEFEEGKRNFSRFSHQRCWKCRKELQFQKFICNSCGALQKPQEDMTYFDLLGVDESFDINIEDLTIKFRHLQMTLHPDKFLYKSKEEKETSELYSRLLNKAYSTLKNPVSRGFYLLKQHQAEPSPNHPLDPQFLVFVMEKNEELEKINSPKELENFLKSNNEEIESFIQKLSDAFQESNISEARVLTMKLNYYMNLDNKAKKKFSDMQESRSN